MSTSEKALQDATALEVAIIGAGISGLNCAYRLKTQLPGIGFTIFENRDDLGGTWDLFKYPGVRSDSDVYTYAFSWHSWPFPRRYAEGSQMVEYLHDAASKHNIQQHIRFRHKLVSADWSSEERRWVLRITHDDRDEIFTTRFLVVGTGYWDYHSPLETKIPGLDNFKGKVIHPQFWPIGYDYANRKVAIIGSGATAVALLPSMAREAAHVTMIQRSPTYIEVSPNSHHWLRSWLPPFSWITACEPVYYMMKLHFLVLFCFTFPRLAKSVFRQRATGRLPSWVEYDPHFNPRYYPWEQRVCRDPDGEFFKVLHRPNAKVVTGQIETVTESGVQMQEGGQAIDADIIVTATGLRMKIGADIDFRVDGEPVSWRKRFMWNGAMLEGLPNMVYMFGYTNNAWTLGADDTAWVLVRLLKLMRGRGAQVATPRIPRDVAAMGTERIWPLSATYVAQVEDEFPVYGKRGPWRSRMQPTLDWLHARWGDVTTGLDFS